MVSSNLLPWRQCEREYQIRMVKKVFALSIALVLVIIMISHLLVSYQESSLQARIVTANKKITEYGQKKLQDGMIVDAVSVANNQKQAAQAALQNQNTFALSMFSELGRRYQEKVCFTDIEGLDKTFLFSGKARSMSELTGFIRHWHMAYLFNEIEIKSIEEQENGFVQFKFQARG